MKEIKGETYQKERALYNIKDLKLVNCRFEGPEDGESALKESHDFELDGCYMDLRYPLWHDSNVILNKVEMTPNCRAAIWYTKDIRINDSIMNGIKAVRECENVSFNNVNIVSPEFGWHSHNVTGEKMIIHSEYLFFESDNITLKNIDFKGKYSFQYNKNLLIENSTLDTKDAFWHVKNGVIRNCVIKGEYLAWYSDGLTLINCTITGTQPFCYCKNLTLINCTMEGCDLAFEYSEAEADIKGSIASVKNPKSGHIVADSFGSIIITEDAVYKPQAKVEVRKI